MTTITLYYKPMITFKLTSQELETLKECAESHYDLTCKGTVKVGGCLNWALQTGDLGLSLVWRDLDLLCKVLEMPGGEALRAKFMQILVMSNEQNPSEATFEV